ncbi:MAG: mannose-1-phosphate guanylyltransferase/mannose-6-phosphate isomerase [Pseudomonadota bacterium]
MNLRPVILSGGSGTRLWPLSRGIYPKQFLPLVDNQKTMLQQTVERLDASVSELSPLIVCNEEHRFLVAEQMQQVGSRQHKILLEPEGRNTAPAIALAAQLLLADEDELMLVMPADHVISDTEEFNRVVGRAIPSAINGKLVTFGIQPNAPETGYGYIHVSAELDEHGSFLIEAFHEKPTAELAESYLKSGDYYWNGGIFLFKASTYLEELEKYAPEVMSVCKKAADNCVEDLDFLRIDANEFLECSSISIDYAVMEHTSKGVVVPLDVGWCDVGSWAALWEVLEKDQNGNVINGDVLTQNVSNCHLHSESKVIAALGVSDLIIVETDDAVMVAQKSMAQEVKIIVDQLKQQERSQASHHRKVYRPWGWYDSIDLGKNFQVKRINVKPGARLSVQKHKFRAEHWVIVSGVAEVLHGETWSTLQANESTYIPIGCVHALRNPDSENELEIVEVQTGEYLGEDDIERLEDDYGRV